MWKLKFMECQIVGILAEGESGFPVAEVCRKHGICNANYFQWKSKYSGISASELKRMYAELALENIVIKDVLSRKF
jgi:putative transposase